MKKLLARFVYWLTGWLPLPEFLEWSLSEWAYRELNGRPSLPLQSMKFGPQQIRKE